MVSLALLCVTLHYFASDSIGLSRALFNGCIPEKPKKQEYAEKGTNSVVSLERAPPIHPIAGPSYQIAEFQCYFFHEN